MPRVTDVLLYEALKGVGASVCQHPSPGGPGTSCVATCSYERDACSEGMEGAHMRDPSPSRRFQFRGLLRDPTEDCSTFQADAWLASAVGRCFRRRSASH